MMIRPCRTIDRDSRSVKMKKHFPETMIAFLILLCATSALASNQTATLKEVAQLSNLLPSV